MKVESKVTRSKAVFYVPSPIGSLRISVCANQITRIEFVKRPEPKFKPKSDPFMKFAEKQIKDYFTGRTRNFNLRYKLKVSDFEKKTLRVISRIPFGATRTYGWIVRSIGAPKACRAVGLACSRNPLLLVIPCHRVETSSGGISGYKGGIWRKRWLLGHERSIMGLRR